MPFNQLHHLDQLPPNLGPQLSTDSLSVVFPAGYGVPIVLTNDTNYGIVGSNTLRTAAQIGNATGAADFGNGASTVQTLRAMLSSDSSVIVSSSALPAGAATESTLSALNVKVVITANGIKVDGSATTQPISGSVSVISSVLPTGASTEATLAALNTKVPANLTVTATRLLVDNSGVTQPVSGSVSVTNFPATQPISAVSLPLPAGAATEATVSSVNTKIPAGLTVTSSRLLVDSSGSTQPISGTVTSNQGTPNTIANGWPVKITDGTNTVSVGSLGNILVSGLSAIGAVPSLNPVSISGIDGGGLKRHFLTNTDGTLRVDNSAVTQPISAIALPLPAGASTEATLAALNAKYNNDFGISSGAIRVASSIGNAAGAALFGAGITTAQVLRVVLPTDQTAIPISNLPTTTATNVGAPDASTIRVAFATGSVITSTASTVPYVTSTRTVHSITPVTLATWVQLVASTSAAINRLTCFSSSGSVLELGVGAAGSETRTLLLPPGGFDAVINLNIPVGSRISVRAVDVSATSGELQHNFLG